MNKFISPLAEMPPHSGPRVLIQALLFISLALPLAAQQPTPRAISKAPAKEKAAPEATAPKGPEPANHAPPDGSVSWRERYELGPGDVLNFSLYGRPELSRRGLRIAPDGTVSFLQAEDVKLTGLTIDEARLAIESKLEAHFKNPRVIVTPEEVGSKRFTILGKVINKGVYTLERPMTLVEAVANAGGMETGLFEQNTIELADLDRSFLSRKGQPLKIDFRRLFLESDMKLNVEIEPGDFIYIASSISNEYYVFGAVKTVGMQGFSDGATVATAITRREGFTDKAWLDHILVIRGSLDKPEVHVVNLKRILAAQEKDFPLKPKDIVYVADRPWSKAEDILGMVTRAFVSSATTNWVNVHGTP